MKQKYQVRMDQPRRLRWILLYVFILTGALQVSAQTYDWGNVAIGGGGFVSAVIAAPNDPNVFYARTDVGGAYRWDEATQSWIPLTDWVSETERGLHGIDGIAVDPYVAGRVYMLAGTSYWNDGKSMFLRSDDYGDTWERFEVTSQIRAHGNGMGRGNGERIAVDPNNSNIIFIGSRFDGMWKSTDRGSSWTQVSSYPVTTTENEAGTSIVIFDPSSASGGVSQTIYAGVGQANDNLYVSHDAGSSWSLVAGRPTTAGVMPQRMAVTSDGNTLYVTYANGAGPHAQTWGGVLDYYNRGAIYKYDIVSGTWTDISPENYMQDLDSLEDVHYGAYSGISIDPNNENRILATSINSWRGVQYWNDDGTWIDKYGDNIFLSEDGGQTWREMFRFYSTENGQLPDYEMVDANGINWIWGGTCHWNSSAVIDPFNSNRAFVTSGNGVWGADSLLNYYTKTDSEGNTTEHGKVTWKFKAHGIDETVPQDLVSVPGGPLISVILDYTGFSHTDVTQYVPAHNPTAGSTTGLAVAAQNPAKVFRVGVQMHYSTDTAKTWTQTGSINGEKGKLALSADGNVLLHSPQGSSVMYRSTDNGSTWSTVSGINTTSSFLKPVADPVNSNKFYTYDPETGAVMRSTDGGASFSQVSTVAIDGWRKLRAAPDREGDIWIALDSAGLVRSTNSGSSFSTISGITICRAVGFGKAASGASYPAVYIWGTINGVTGIHQSIDEGATWVRVNDDDHEYGGPANGEYVVGDMNVYGRVYMSTAGRGIVYGEPNTCTPSYITPYVQVNGGSWEQTDSVSLVVGDTLVFGPQATTGGSWSWTGPDAFSATTREVTIADIQTTQAGDYMVTYTNDEGCESTQTFNVTVTEENTASVWLEAECGTVGSLWNTDSDANASNDQYMTVQSGNNSLSSAPGTDGQISYSFSVSESGTYKVWARVITPSADDDSFWVRMDGGSWILWNNIPSTSTWQWDDLHDSNNSGSVVSYNLSAGDHILTVAYREDGAQLDKILVTNTGAAPSGEGSAATNCTVSGANAWLEGECGTVGSLWNTGSDANASNDQYVTVQSGNNSLSSAPGTSGQINYNFSVSESGTYKVWARVITPNGNDDSFWVRVDGGSWILWNNIPATSTWQWDDVHDSNNGGSAVGYNLSSGNHTLTIAYREDGALLDKVLVTNSGTAPSGEGTVATNCSGDIVVRARGTQGDETIDLRVDGTTVATWTLTTTLADYTVSGSGAVTVHFTNDAGGRDVQVDYVTMDGVTYQSEDQATNTGVWKNSSCGGSNSEWLHCSGYIDYASASGARVAENLGAVNQRDVVVYPNPSEDGVFTIDLPESLSDSEFGIYDQSGKAMVINRFKGYGVMELETGLKSGIYLLRILGTDAVAQRKLIIK